MIKIINESIVAKVGDEYELDSDQSHGPNASGEFEIVKIEDGYTYIKALDSDAKRWLNIMADESSLDDDQDKVLKYWNQGLIGCEEIGFNEFLNDDDVDRTKVSFRVGDRYHVDLPVKYRGDFDIVKIENGYIYIKPLDQGTKDWVEDEYYLYELYRDEGSPEYKYKDEGLLGIEEDTLDYRVNEYGDIYPVNW